MRRQKPGIKLWALVSFAICNTAQAESWSPVPPCGDRGAAEILDVGLRGTYEAGTVPPFRVATRDRAALGPAVCLRLRDRVQLTAAWDWVLDRNGIGEITQGPGDIRLGTVVQTFQVHGWHVDAGWMVKLPNARDEEELGTDETDVTLGISGGWRGGPWDLQAGIALGIWGNPLRFAAQDDVILVRAEGWWSHESWALAGTVQSSPESDRNPSRIQATATVRAGKRWYGQLSGGAGFTPASPDGILTVGFGYRTEINTPSSKR